MGNSASVKNVKEEKKSESHSQEEQYKCVTCEYNFDDIFYCTKCKQNGTELKMWCKECGEFLHKKKDHTFDIEKSYIKSGKKVVFETKNVAKIKEAYHTKLSNSLQLYIQDKSEECLQLIKKELLEFDYTNFAPVAGIQAVSLGAVAAINEASSHIVCMGATATVLPGLSYGCLSAVEIGHAGWQLYKGRISVREFWITTGKSVIKCGAGVGGSIGGFALGALIGTTVGPVGTIIGGIIGAVVGGAISYTAAEKGSNTLWDWLKAKYPWLDGSEKKQKETLLKAALKEFGIENTEDKKFNEAYVKRKFKSLARVWHPDRKDGSLIKFQDISGHYAILLAILENGTDEIEKKQTLEMIKAITYK